VKGGDFVKLKWVRSKLADEWLAKHGEHQFSVVRKKRPMSAGSVWHAYVDGQFLTIDTCAACKDCCERWLENKWQKERDAELGKDDPEAAVLKLHQDPTPEQLNAQKKEEAQQKVLEGWAGWVMRQEEQPLVWGNDYANPDDIVLAWLDWMREGLRPRGKPLIDVLTEEKEHG
jgi:hypothetical protein